MDHRITEANVTKSVLLGIAAALRDNSGKVFNFQLADGELEGELLELLIQPSGKEWKVYCVAVPAIVSKIHNQLMVGAIASSLSAVRITDADQLMRPLSRLLIITLPR